jgi:hypothetical protein
MSTSLLTYMHLPSGCITTILGHRYLCISYLSKSLSTQGTGNLMVVLCSIWHNISVQCLCIEEVYKRRNRLATYEDQGDDTLLDPSCPLLSNSPKRNWFQLEEEEKNTNNRMHQKEKWDLKEAMTHLGSSSSSAMNQCVGVGVLF